MTYEECKDSPFKIDPQQFINRSLQSGLGPQELMALSATIYRFTLEISDVDRGIYETIEARVAKHPSESNPYLLTRLIAYVLNLQEGIEFTKGISTPDEPAIWVKDLTGKITTWIDIGNPSPKRLHKAAKAAQTVRIYTHRDPKILMQEVAGEDIYKIEQVELFAIAPAFLSELEKSLQRDNHWKFLHDDGEISISCGGVSAQGEITQHRLSK